MLFLENMKLAFLAIKVNKMRSFLTMLGIIIGITAVISIVSIGDTMRGAFSNIYNQIGVNQVAVWIYGVDYYTDNELFSFDELDKIKSAFPEEIQYISSYSSASLDVSNGRKKTKIGFTGVREGYAEAANINIVSGRMINDRDWNGKKMNIVIDEDTAVNLFGKKNATGQILRADINGVSEELNIVGIYKKESSFLSAMLMSSTPEAYIAETAITGGTDTKFWDIRMYVSDPDDKVFRTRFTGLVARMKNLTPENIFYNAAADEMSTMDGVLGGMSVAVGAIAGISLLVGGIGIMNIMLVSVTERTREIGIRKALGARTKDVLIQFLIESAILSAAGGVIGTALGIGLVLAGGAAIGIPVVVNPAIVVIAVAFAAIVGVFFGIYPARKAAMADPIEALRYE